MFEDEVQEVKKLLAAAQTTRASIGGKPFVIIEDRQKIQSLEDLQRNPTRKIGHPKFTQAPSFCAYVNDHKDAATRLYIPTPIQFVAVIDHHAATPAGSPDWAQHRATLDLKPSQEWNLWNGKQLAKMDQRAFAQFIEDNLDEITSPEGAELLDLVRSIKATQHAEFSSVVDEKPGVFQMSYAQTAKTTAGQKGELEIPTGFVLTLSPYEGGVPLNLYTRLRFEISGGKLFLWYEFVRACRFLDDALRLISGVIAKETGLTPWYGTPA